MGLNALKPPTRAILSNPHLENQLRIKFDGPSLAEFDPSDVIAMWRKTLRSTSKSGKLYQKRINYCDLKKDDEKQKAKNNDLVVFTDE